MEHDRIHRAISDDGTEIAGRVHGQGPPLVLVHGALEDGDTCWASLLPLLSERFTCYAMSLRGRGLSGPSADLSPERLLEDVTAFVDSIGEPVFLVGESGGGFKVLAAAARTSAVAAVAAYEPVVFEVQSKEAAGLGDVVAHVGAAAAEGRLEEGVRIFAEWVGNDEEMAALSAADDVIQGLAANVPIQLEEFVALLRSQGAAEPEGPSPTHPAELAKITVPVLLLRGSSSALGDWAVEGVRHIADHVAEAHMREIPGAGHFGPALHPEPIADELIHFFEPARQPA